LYVILLIVVAAATFGIMQLERNIATRKREAEQVVFKLVDVTEETVDPAEWGKNFPRQFDSYRRTVDTERTKHGGSEAFQKLDDDPRWRVLFAGYAFGVDYREERGHAYMLSDQEMTERVLKFKQPGACLHCHSSVVPAYRAAGRDAGVADVRGFNWPQVLKGFEVICAMPYAEARPRVEHPVACVDCHDPQSMQLRVTRPAFLLGIQSLARSDDPVPHLASVQRWRAGTRASDYDPNAHASRQEMRSFVCSQCHVEYYFKGAGKLLTYPWSGGLTADEIESYYDDTAGHTDWTHPTSGAKLLKAQHPEFELWSQGVHARSGVACADCHMPYGREGAIKISDHHVRSPLLNVARACQTCHRFSEGEIRARAETIQDRTKGLLARGEEAVLDLVRAIEAATTAGVADERLESARALHRRAQWRLDFVAAENSMGFHAPQEAARLLAETIDYARQGQVQAVSSSRSASR
jgi:nitrite reductase (cytochrome c-552)